MDSSCGLKSYCDIGEQIRGKESKRGKPKYIIVSGPPGATGDRGRRGPRGYDGCPGPAGGPPGATGETGPRGYPGHIITGDGAPYYIEPDPDKGDVLYFDTSTGNVYFYKYPNWLLVGNIRGPRGHTGGTGQTGPRGHTGQRGDDGYGFDGATGATGATGPMGPTGNKIIQVDIPIAYIETVSGTVGQDGQYIGTSVDFTSNTNYAYINVSASGIFTVGGASTSAVFDGNVIIDVLVNGNVPCQLVIPFRSGDERWLGSMERRIIVSNGSSNNITLAWRVSSPGQNATIRASSSDFIAATIKYV